MSKCKKCGTGIEYLIYYCDSCEKKLAGKKPRKSKKSCIGCTRDWYNDNRSNGCYSYNDSEIIIMPIYYSLSQVVPNPKWKLNCFDQQK